MYRVTTTLVTSDGSLVDDARLVEEFEDFMLVFMAYLDEGYKPEDIKFKGVEEVMP